MNSRPRGYNGTQSAFADFNSAQFEIDSQILHNFFDILVRIGERLSTGRIVDNAILEAKAQTGSSALQPAIAGIGGSLQLPAVDGPR